MSTLCQHCESAPAPSRGRYCSALCRNRAAWERRKSNPESLARALANYRKRDTPELNRQKWERRREGTFYKAQHPGRTDLMGPECIEEGCAVKPVARGRCLKHYRKVMKQEGAAWARLSDNASRAAHFGVEYHPFNKRDVYERDGWVCKLCGDPVDPGVKFPLPWSASLDHVVPMSKGGAHHPDNAQLAHLGCNKAKGDGGVKEHVPTVTALYAAGFKRAEIVEATGLPVRTVDWIRKRYATPA